MAALVWSFPFDSVTGTRWTRCVPDSNFSLEYTSSPSITAEQSFTPPSSVSLMLAISSFQPRLSAYMVYIRKRECANSAASSPPVPARISKTTFRPSSGSFGSKRMVSFSFRLSSSALASNSSSCAISFKSGSWSSSSDSFLRLSAAI